MYYEKKISASMRERKRLRFGLDIKSINQGGYFAGYASVFDVIDNQRDIIVHGAFRQTLKDRTSEIKLLWQHQQSDPIGVFHNIKEDEVGLYVEGQLLLEVAKAKEAYALLKAGAVKGLSIGYSPVQYHIDAESGVRYLSELELWEISLVTFPANPVANVTVVKQFNPILTNEETRQWQNALQTGHLLELAGALDKALAVLR